MSCNAWLARVFHYAIWATSWKRLPSTRAAPGNATLLAEEVRAALRRQITFKYSNPDGGVGVFFLIR